MEEKYCQSCAMPMSAPGAEYGTNADGSKNEDYCSYCFADGKFISEDCTMEQMIAYCVPPMVENNPGMTEDKARAMMQECMPTLKRWKTN